MENNDKTVEFEQFCTDMGDIRKNLFALNIEIRELTKKIDKVDSFITRCESAIILHGLESIEKTVKYFNSPEYLNSVDGDDDGDKQCDLLSTLSNKENMQD